MGVRYGHIHGPRHETHAEQYRDSAVEAIHPRSIDQHADTHALFHTSFAMHSLSDIQRRVDERQ